MKKLLYIVPVILILTGFSAKYVMDQKVKELFGKIKLSEESAENMIWSNSSGPSFYYPGPGELKNLTSGDKAALVPVIGSYVKSYTESAEFKERYQEYRQMKYPAAPEKPTASNELLEQQKQGIKEAIENFEKLKKEMPDQKEMFDENIKMFKEQLKELDNPDNPMADGSMDEMMQQNYQEQLKYHEAAVAEWEKKYPENDHKWMIKEWLNKFLDETKNIDFNAQLVDKGKKKLFAKPEYEKKSSVWKTGFRAGKEATEAVRTFAQQWLSEL